MAVWSQLERKVSAECELLLLNESHLICNSCRDSSEFQEGPTDSEKPFETCVTVFYCLSLSSRELSKVSSARRQLLGDSAVIEVRQACNRPIDTYLPACLTALHRVRLLVCLSVYRRAEAHPTESTERPTKLPTNGPIVAVCLRITLGKRLASLFLDTRTPLL